MATSAPLAFRLERPLVNVITELAAGRSRWPLFVTGCAGSGKTNVLRVVCDYGSGLYGTLDDWFDGLLACVRGEARERSWSGELEVTPALYWRRLAEATLVAVDEVAHRGNVVAHHFGTPYDHAGFLKRLLDVREGLPLLVASNLPLEAAGAAYDERVASRLGAGSVYMMMSGDRRQGRSQS
jgi:hypothetical protein